MCAPQRLVLIASSILVGLCKALPSGTRDDQINPTYFKRFLFTNGNIVFCNGTCNTFCAYGYQKAATGCSLCACVVSTTGSFQTPAPSSNVNFLPSNFSTNAGHIGTLFDRPCDPSVRHCPLQCKDGYRTGTNGCQLCACVNALPVITVTPSSSTPTSTSSTNPSRTSLTAIIQSSTLSVLSPSVSTAIYTTSDPYLSATSVSTSTLGTTKVNSGYFDPCISTQIVCTKNCNNDYVLGPEGCQYCLCADRIPQNLRPTTTLAPVIPPGSGKSNYSITMVTVSPTPSTEACIMAKVICNDKCPNGFVSHPDDCLFCSCLQSASDQSDMTMSTRLRTPCIYKTNTCMMTCISGYITGPRDCQFCSCKQ